VDPKILKALNEKKYRVTMPNESIWEVPVRVIARDHATYYAGVDEITVEESYALTAEIFLDDDYEVEDWAKNNMNWEDVVDKAVCVESPETDFQEGWVNGEAEVV